MYASQPNLRSFSTIWNDKVSEEASVEEMEIEDGSLKSVPHEEVNYEVGFTGSKYSLKRMCYMYCSEAASKGLSLLERYSVVNGLSVMEATGQKKHNNGLKDVTTKTLLYAFQFLVVLSPDAIVVHSYLNERKKSRKWLLIKHAIQYWTVTTLKKYRKYIVQDEVKDPDMRQLLTKDVAEGVERLLRQLLDIYPDLVYIIAAEIDCASRAEYSFYHNLHLFSSIKSHKLLSTLIDSTEACEIQWQDKRVIRKIKNITLYCY